MNILFAAAAVAAPLPWPVVAQAARPMPGSYTKAAIDDPDVTAAARAALRHLPRKRPQLRRVVSAEKQVVAGMNCRLLLLLKDGTSWRVTVWHKLDGGHEVTQVSRAGKLQG